MKTLDRRWHKPGPVHRPMTLILAALLLLSQSAVLPTAPAMAAPAAAAPAASQPSQSAGPQSTAFLTPVSDATLDETQPDTPLGNEPTLEVFYGGPGEIGRALIRFNLAAALPAEAVIDAATLHLNLLSGAGADPVTLTASNLLADWVESTVTWNTRPLAGEPTALAPVSAAAGIQSLDVTDIVRAWHNAPHYGLQLAGPESGDNYWRTIESREPDAAPPELEVVYHLPAPPTYTFSGYVTHGEPPDPGAPLEGATVQLFGAEGGEPFLGPTAYLTATTSGPDGAFDLQWQDESFPHYHLVQTAPAGFYPVASAPGATGVPGEAGTSTAAHIITYAGIVSGTYEGVAFWDQPLPEGCQEWLANGGFERGEFGPWGNAPGMALDSGREDAWGVLFGGENDSVGEIWQPVLLPEEAGQLLLTFWWLAEAAEEQPGDALELIIQYGDELADRLAIMPAVEPLGEWRYGVADLSAYAGQQVGLTFLGRTDAEIPATFRLDDVSLIACDATPSDLVVSGIDWDQDAGVCYLIENLGEGIAPAGHQAALWVDGAPVAEQWVDAILAPGQGHGACFDYAWACSHPDDQVSVEADTADRLAEADEGNNSHEQTWPCDTTPPQITGPEVTDLTATSALIAWETDEPADSLVRYDKTARGFAHSVSDSALVGSHALPLTGLEPSTVYRFVVESADAGGNTAASEALTFETLPLPDTEDPTVDLTAPAEWRGTVRISATADDNRGVEKVAFCLTAGTAGTDPQADDFSVDGELLLTDYAPPYELDLDSNDYPDGAYVLTARAYDLASRSATTGPLQVNLANADPSAPQVTISAPAAGATVGGKVTITADVSDDRALGDVVFKVDGTQIGFQTNPPDTQSATAQFTWDSTQVGNDSYPIEVKAYDLQGNTGQDTVTVSVYNAPPPPQPYLIVTGHTAARSGNTITINLTVKNAGASAASQIRIQDYMQGFQPISQPATSPGTVAYQARYSPGNQAADCGITDPNGLGAGASRIYTFQAVPVLNHPNPPTPSFGHAVKVQYEGAGAVKHSHDYKHKIWVTTALESIPTAHANAVKGSSFLIMTHPGELFANYYWYDVDDLLSTMAELARVKTGVLGYLGTKNKSTIEKLVEPSGAWAKALAPSFSQLYGGALLIVGETEIVPAWEQGGFSIGWNPVKYSDQPYADTGGNSSPAPELLVGRIVGDHPDVMVKPIQASIGVYTGASGYAFDQAAATLISGPGFGTFVTDIQTNSTILHNKGLLVAPVHTKDYFRVSHFSRPYQTAHDLAVGDVRTSNTNDEIVIADSSTDKVYVYNASGTLLNDFYVGYGGNAFDAGDRIAIAGSNIVMADASANRILLYDGLGSPQGNFSVDLAPFDALDTGDVTGDSAIEIAVADQSANRVYFYSTGGTKLSQEVVQPFDKYDLMAVGDVMGDGKDEIVMTDRSANKIMIYRADDTLLASHQFKMVNLPGKTMTWLEYLDYDTGQKADLGGSALAVGNLYPWPGGADSGKEEIILAPARHHDHILVYWWKAADSKLAGTGPIPWNFDGFEGLASGEIGTYGGRVQDEVFVADLSGHLRILDTENWRSRFHTALPTYTPDADILFLSGHGNVDGCCGLSSYRDPIWPLNFNQHNPVVWATSCLTGNYQDNADKWNFPETMLKSGAAAYIGATQSSHGGEDRPAAQWLFNNWDPGESIGRVFTELERLYWKGSQTDYWWFWAYEYNLYGDPTFGTATSSQAAPQAEPPPPTLQIDVPMYTVTRTQGLDWVEIPGGRLPTAPGEPWLPYYVTSLPVPAGTRVQEVALLERTGLVTDTGLLLPMSPITPTACACTPEPYPGTEAGWLPEEAFTWETIDNTDGTSSLVITTYPFFYNPQTTASRFYQHYTFELATASTAMALTGLATDQAEYAPGELVGIEVGLLNAGPPQDAVLSTLIRRSGSLEIVAGLPLESLDDLQGPASFAFEWDPGELEPGYYEVEVTLRDPGGAVLDRESERFRLGVVSGEILELTASPTHFDPGDPIDLSLTFRNNGSAPLSGQARIEVQDEAGGTVAEFSHDITDLAPGGTVTLPEAWDTTGEPEGTYRIIATVAYDSTATPTASTEVSTQAQNLIYLPLIVRQ